MATDLLQLGGITFDAYSTPDILPNGGRQEMNSETACRPSTLDKAARDYLLDSVLARIGHSR